MKANPFIQCAACQVTYGVRLGSMPDGKMWWSHSSNSLDGYYNCGTIEFGYDFPDGFYQKDGKRTAF